MDHLARLNDDMFPFARLLGIRFVSAEPDRVVAEMEVRADLCTRPAVAHGGAVAPPAAEATGVTTAMAAAAASRKILRSPKLMNW